MKRIFVVIFAVVLLYSSGNVQEIMPAGSQSGSKSLNFIFDGLGSFGLNGSGPAGGL